MRFPAACSCWAGGSAGVELAQGVQRLGGEAVIIEGADRLLPREPAPLGEALGEALRRDGIQLMLGIHASAAKREGDEYVLEFDAGTELRGDRLLVATGRRPRVASHSSRVPTLCSGIARSFGLGVIEDRAIVSKMANDLGGTRDQAGAAL
jgi:pyruvate/2-oxoglutarate dehydrogenase complex dihydrolipoamide dehydrogenase (E3) component